MLKKIYRVNKNWEYQQIYRKGRGLGSQFFGINYLPNKYGFLRFGIVVSKKTDKKATARNVIKRRLREAAGAFNTKKAGGFDIIISVRPKAVGANFQTLLKELEIQLIRAKILK